MRAGALPEGLIDAALLDGIRRAVGAGVVEEVVAVLAEDLVCVVVAEEVEEGAVAEGEGPLAVGAVDGLAGGVEHEAEAGFG